MIHSASRFNPCRQPSTTALPAMPATFAAAHAALTELREARAFLQSLGRDFGASVLTDAIEELEAQLGVNQVRA